MLEQVFTSKWIENLVVSTLYNFHTEQTSQVYPLDGPQFVRLFVI